MSSTSRIAKNTIALYFRQILIMLVSLYTVRVVLNTLGAENYGIYNVVAGVVVLFSFVNNAMATSVQRFLNFYLGKNDTEKTRNVYSASLVIHGIICLIFTVLAETVGLWFVNAKLNIPTGRSNAAFWCYQTAVITTLANIMRVPYNAVIIAYEKMSFFAGLSIVEAVLKLSVVFLLKITHLDKLVFYSFLLTGVSFVILAIYKFYCNKNFEIAHYRKNQDKGLGKELVSFSGWSLFGAVANVANTQGTNIVLNIFTNVTVNAAMGIANQVNAAVYSFVSNFQTAFNPQLVKNYAAGEKKELNQLIFRASKFSFLLLWLIVLPLSLNLETVLTLWLKNVPEYSVVFVQLILICSLVDCMTYPIAVAVQASGNIKFYQIIISCFIFANLPLSILFRFWGMSPYSVLFIRFFLCLFILVFRVLYLNFSQSFSVKNFIFQVLLRCAVIVAISFFITKLLTSHFSGLGYFICSCLFSVFSIIVLSFPILFTPEERKYAFSFIRKFRR